MQKFLVTIAQIVGCRTLFTVETKEAAGEASEEIAAIWIIRSPISDDSCGDLFPVGRRVADETAQEIGMLPIVFGLFNLSGVGSTFAPSRLHCGQIFFFDGGDQPSAQLLSYLVFSRSTDVDDGAFDETCNCFRCGWNRLVCLANFGTRLNSRIEFRLSHAGIGAVAYFGTPEKNIGKQREFQF